MPGMGWGGVGAGAGSGAAVGSAAGPWGAAIGAGIGALGGLFSGGDNGRMSPEELMDQYIMFLAQKAATDPAAAQKDAFGMMTLMKRFGRTGGVGDDPGLNAVYQALQQPTTYGLAGNPETGYYPRPPLSPPFGDESAGRNYNPYTPYNAATRSAINPAPPVPVEVRNTGRRRPYEDSEEQF